MNEMWKPIEGHKCYEVSDLGRVRSRRRTLQTFGVGKLRAKYPAVSIHGKNYKVHRLVAITFLGACPPGMEVNHKDGNKSNPNLANLEYVTPRDNAMHAFRHGLRICPGDRKRKLTANAVREIRASFEPRDILAARFGVSGSLISNVRHGRRGNKILAAQEFKP